MKTEMEQIDPTPEEKGSLDVCMRLLKGSTRHNPFHFFHLWAGALCTVLQWMYEEDQKEGKGSERRKWASHVGAHFLDWVHSEIWKRAGRKVKGYVVIGNGTYKILMDFIRPALREYLLQNVPDNYGALKVLDEQTSEGKIGDMF